MNKDIIKDYERMMGFEARTPEEIMKPCFDLQLRLIKKSFTGKITLHFHQGSLKKVSEEKEVKL